MQPKSIKEAILEQANDEAEKIVEEARKKAQRILKNAEEEKNKMMEAIRSKAIEEANRMVERIQSEANADAKKIMLEKKAALLAKITEEIREVIEQRKFNYAAEESIKSLLLEGLPMFSKESKLRVFVNSKDLSAAKRVLQELKPPNSVSVEAKNDMLGGVIIESSDGLLRIDSSYDTRMRNYLEAFLPDIRRILFES